MKFSKKYLVMASLLATTFIIPSIFQVALAENDTCIEKVLKEPTTLSITGTATRQVAPDYAVLSLGIDTRATSVSEAKNKNDAVMSRLIANLQTLGIPKNQIVTSNFSVNPSYQNTGNGSTISYYQIQNNVTVKISKLNLVSKVIDRASQSGANTINSLNFYSNKGQAFDDLLVKEAVADARHRADVLANALGMHIVGVKTVSISPMRTVGEFRTMSFAKMAMDTSTPIEQGQLEIDKNVNITYILK